MSTSFVPPTSGAAQSRTAASVRLSLGARVLQACLRILLAPIAALVWRLRVRGREELPRGGCLLVPNHVSYVDSLVVACAARRGIVFLMAREYFDVPLFGAVARWCGTLPVEDGASPNATRELLERAARHIAAGDTVCIYAEGAISRDGSLRSFRRGLERIARAAHAPVVPVRLDGLAESWFGFVGGRPFRKRPRLATCVHVRFGAPLPDSVPSWKVERAVGELGAARALEAARDGDDAPRLISRATRQYASRTAVIESGGRRLSYRELGVAATLFARRLRREIEPRARVAVWLPQGIAGTIVNLALAMVGASAVNLNTTLSEGELAEQCARARVTALFTSRRFLEALERRSPLDPELGRTTFVEDWLAGASVLERCLAYCVWRAALWTPRLDPASTEMALMFTSGSTARARGVRLSQANVLSNVQSLANEIALGPEDRLLAVLPLFHGFGYTIALWAPLARGATILTHTNPLDAKTVVRLAREERATILLATPFFYQAWMRRAEPADFEHVRFAASGAQRLPAELMEAWRERFGLRLVEGYGATELGPAVSFADAQRSPQGSVGRPLPGVALRITDVDTGEDLGPERDGLLWVRGPGRMLGYLDASDDVGVLEGEWYSTGDVARIDPSGELTIVDRLARFSKIGGERVAHARIEAALGDALRELGAHADAEFSVTAVDDGVRGERLVVVHANVGVSIAAWIAQLARSDLPRLFAPRAEAFLDVASLPKLGSGKVDLGAIRRLAREAPRAA